MKKRHVHLRPRFVLIVLIGLFSTACNKYDLEPKITPSEGLNIIIGNQLKITSSEIDYYDQSSGLFYMNWNHKYNFTDYYSAKFWITDNKEPVLMGAGKINCPCGIDSTIRTELLIAEGYPKYTMQLVKISYNQRYYWSDEDERKSELFVNTLKKYGKLRKGLALDLDEIKRIDWNHLQLRVKVTNLDTVNYYILDPEKMESGLYHYYTPGLYLLTTNDYHYYNNNVKTNYPSDIDLGYEKRLTLIENGEELFFTFDYTQFDSIAPGTYTAGFTFPGLTHQVLEKNDLRMDNGIIWLGKLGLKEEVVLF